MFYRFNGKSKTSSGKLPFIKVEIATKAFFVVSHGIVNFRCCSGKYITVMMPY